jgi:hypothetical protein
MALYTFSPAVILYEFYLGDMSVDEKPMTSIFQQNKLKKFGGRTGQLILLEPG